MIYVSKPSIVSVAGISADENILNLQTGKRFLTLCDSFIEGKSLMLGKIDISFEKFSPKTPKYFKTRTNALVLNAMMQIDNTIKDAIKKRGKNRVGVVIGTTTSGVEENYKIFKEHTKTGFFDIFGYNVSQNALANPAEFIADFYGLNGVCFAVSTACTSGVKAIIEAKRLIKAGICDAVICGGVDSLNTLTINGFHSLGILSEGETNPFSKNRDGINIGEGAGLFVLNKDEISDIVIAGEHSNCDAFHMTQPETSGKMQGICIQEALKKANLSEVDYINLHGTGTVANDQAEAAVINANLPNTPASSIKPAIGHTLGAAGAIESSICVMLCMQKEVVLPPHIYDGIYDEEIKRVNLVKINEKAVVNSAMSLSFAFGGDNAAIIFERVR
ncbi:beta-ketoacyl synthase N-terminal-like domain-containing protein [Campylobacter sp. RM16188]|uniref:beta-ketoacyl synthase N-terminal-like domain-containing protein n=1 Tax=Campylobacter sp. RM16188 TaxID=1705725 RepID=UPI00155301A8|nr:beta-ketoacyl synthase N-terminal-like domain-containing protein [Campylobacter sp. RM16188]